jgi:GT2 family glycosyltransferase
MDERYFLFLEDVEWCLRARRLGIEIWFNPQAVVQHEVSASTGTLSREEVFYYGCRNTYRLAFSYQQWPLRLRMGAEVGKTLAGLVARWARSAGFRGHPMQRARARAILDFVRARSGPATFVGARRHGLPMAAMASRSQRP